MTFLEILESSRLETIRSEAETLNVLREVVDLHFSLFAHRRTLEANEDNKLQRVWLALTTSAAHSSRVALDALESGYYTQCFMLTRSVFEDWLTAYDCDDNPETVDALLDSGKSMPRFSTMYDRLPCGLKRLWGRQGDYEGTYGFLSTFAHPRFRAVEDTLSQEGRVRIVPEYNGMRFALGAWFFLKANLLMLDFVERLADYLVSPESLAWRNSQLESVKPQAYTLFESLDRRLLSYLEQPEG